MSTSSSIVQASALSLAVGCGLAAGYWLANQDDKKREARIAESRRAANQALRESFSLGGHLSSSYQHLDELDTSSPSRRDEPKSPVLSVQKKTKKEERTPSKNTETKAEKLGIEVKNDWSMKTMEYDMPEKTVSGLQV
jgi:hypothetical protein